MGNRRMDTWVAASVLAGSLLATGSGCNRLEAKVDQNVTVTRADHDRTVKVAKGGRVTVRLPWSPGTGYDWVPAKVDGAFLQQEGEPATEPNKEPMPGAPETRIFHFRTLKPGQTTLEFHSRRVWEKDVPPVDTFRIMVTIDS